MPGYFNTNYGKHCDRCGKDISNRSKGTLHCFDCQKIIDKENTQKRRERRQQLEERDIPTPPEYKFKAFEAGWYECMKCGNTLLNSGDNFCRHCGQRLRGEA